jgi:hypothetical protein
MAEDRRINRRQILKGAGAVGVGALAALAPATVLADEDKEDNGKGLLGTWHAPHTHETGPFAGTTTDGNITFAPGGALIAHDTDQPATGLGNWLRHGENGFRFTFHIFVFVGNPPPPPGTKVKVRAQGTRDGNSIRGRFSFQVYDPSGNPIPGFAGTGSFGGARIPVEPV